MLVPVGKKKHRGLYLLFLRAILTDCQQGMLEVIDYLNFLWKSNEGRYLLVLITGVGSTQVSLHPYVAKDWSNGT